MSTVQHTAGQAGQDGSTEATAKLEEQLSAAKKEASDNYDRFMRTAADLENFKRRALREKEELRQFAIDADIARVLLPRLVGGPDRHIHQPKLLGGIGDFELRPGKSGQFDVTIDGDLRFTRAKVGRFPTDSEIDSLSS